MGDKVPNRQDALELLHKYNETDSLRKHAYAVAGVMRHIARKRGQDEEKWGFIGLIHDLDYEKYPAEHCSKTRVLLQEQGWPGEYIRADISHGFGICSEVEPKSDLEKVLYTFDELTGLVVTTALIRPSKSVMDVNVKSVKNKWKDKRFAAGVNREVIEKGAQMLGVPWGVGARTCARSASVIDSATPMVPPRTWPSIRASMTRTPPIKPAARRTGSAE